MLVPGIQEKLFMNPFRAFLFGSALLTLLFSAAAVQPALAQQDQPTLIHHRLLPAGKTCVDCHKVHGPPEKKDSERKLFSEICHY